MEGKLIEAVRGRLVLYDTSHPDYLKVKFKSQVWEEVAKEIDMKSGSDAKRIWEKLRHSLRDAQRRQKKCASIGAPSKPWKFQAKMGFLLPYMAKMKRDRYLANETDEESPTQNNIEFEDDLKGDSVVEHEGEKREEGDMCKNTSKTLTPEGSLDLPGPSRENTPPQLKRKKTIENVDILLKKSIEKMEKKATERVALLNSVQPLSDPLYHFFMSMYQTTKRMPPPSQHLVRDQIYKSVTDMEASLLEIPQRNTFQLPQLHPYHFQHQFDHYSTSESSSTPEG